MKIENVLAHYAGAMIYKQRTGRLPSPDGLARLVAGGNRAMEGYKAKGCPLLAHHVLENFNDQDLGQIYQRLKGKMEKKDLGQVFTPPEAVKSALELLGDFQPKNIIDPTCGAGDFLVAAAGRWPGAKLTGIDIDALALAVANTKLALQGANAQLVLGDALTQKFGQYDLVIGNPPWGTKLDKRQVAGFVVAGKKVLNSFVYFLELAARLLKPRGKLSLVLPEAFLKVWGYQGARQWFLENFTVDAIHYCPKLFRGYYAPAIIISATLVQEQVPTIPIYYQAEAVGEKQVLNTIPSSALTSGRYSITWNQEMEDLWQLCGKDAVFLQEGSLGDTYSDGAVVDFSLGIVTGDNKRFVVPKQRDGFSPLLTAKDVEPFAIKRPSNWLKYDRYQLQQTAPLEKYQVSEKIVYRFISREIIAAIDYTGALTLNNLNIIVPLHLPFTLEYLVGLLNSRLLNTFYMYKFFTGKVLTRHLKQLPLKLGPKHIQAQIAQLTREVRRGKADIRDLDPLVYQLYNLTPQDIRRLEAHYQRLKGIFFV